MLLSQCLTLMVDLLGRVCLFSSLLKNELCVCVLILLCWGEGFKLKSVAELVMLK